MYSYIKPLVLIFSFYFSFTVYGQINIDNSFTDINSSYNVYTNNYYSPGDEITISVNAYNISKKPEFKFRVYKIKDIEGFYSRQSSNSSIDVLSKDSLNLLSLTDEIESITRTFKTQGSDSYYYVYESIKIKNPGKGAYLVSASYKNKIAYTGFFVTELGLITEAGNNGMLVYSVNRKSGEPVNNVDLSFNLGKRKIGTGSTVNGIFFKGLNEADIEYAKVNEISYPLVIAKNGNDVIVSDPNLYFGYGYNKYSAYIFTNQPVYRPETKVQFKGIIRQYGSGEYKNYPYKDVTIIIKDSKGAEVFKTVAKTNSNGSFDGEFDIIKDAPLGTYYIYANLDENLSFSGSFDVEEFKKPEYKVNITIDKDQYSNGDNVNGVVQSDYYFGSPVQDAGVEYNIYKQPYQKPWWYFSDYRWWYEDYYANQNENSAFSNAEMIYSGTGNLDKNGRFDFSYIITEDFKYQNPYRWYHDDHSDNSTIDYKYIVQAKVTDKSRREISSTKTFYVTRASFQLVANTDKYLYKPEEKIMLNVRAFDFAEKPVETNFEAVVNKLTWGTYPDYKQQRDYVTTVSGRTQSDGQGMVSFNASGEGYYEIAVTSNDSRGNKVTTETYSYVSTGDMWWYNQAGGIQIIPDKDSYKKGETCKALIITAVPNTSVLVSVATDDILKYEVHKIEGTSKLIEIPINNNYSPNFYINVSYVKEGVFSSGHKSVMVLPDDKFLTVSIGADKDTYKPKEEGTVSVKVTDEFGSPVPNAEFSLGLVDESIYAIKADNTKDVRKFFYSPKPQAVYTSFTNNGGYYGYSRFISIYERFNIKSLSDRELGTVKGRLINKKGEPLSYATIVIDGDYFAGLTNDNGEFEFKLPEGSYTVGVITEKRTSESEREIEVSRSKTTKVNLKIDGNTVNIDPGIVAQREAGTDDISTNGIILSEAEEYAPKSSDKRESKKEKNSKGDETDFVEADLRSDFRDAVIWMPSAITDNDGLAYIKVNYPDNLTEWRFTSRVITEDTKVGQNIKTVITRKDLLVRMETPRFLQQKDEVIISTIVHNYLSEDKTTKVSFASENVLLVGVNEQMITLGKNEEKRIDWRIKVTEPNGFAKLTASALTDQESDAVELKVPLQPHGLKITDYMAMDITDVNSTETREVIVPEYSDMRSTKLSLNVSPSLAATMLGALDQLVGYPYGCVEQTMSRFLPTVIVANTFRDLNAPLNEATLKDLPKMVEAGYNRLYSMQHYDGGWGWWTNDASNPFMSAYVLYGLHLGDAAGYPVRKDVIEKGISSLKTQLENESLDPATVSYMLYSLSYIYKDKKLYEKFFDKLLSKTLNDYAVSLLSMAAFNVGDIEASNQFNNKLIKNIRREGETAAYWGGQAWHYNWQDDKVQTTAMAVKAIVNNPGSLSNNKEILDKAVRWLMMQKQGPSWNSTQETAFIIYALIDYLKTSKELEPDYSVKVFVNDKIVLEKQMTREDVFKKDIVIEIDGIDLNKNSNNIRIEKNGVGKIYLSSKLDYFTTDEVIRPVENGFRVEREYFKLEKYEHYADDKITYKKRYFDGNVKSGDEILVKVKVYSRDDNMQYFMLEDPIPAGCEVIKDDWAYKIDEEKDYAGYDYYWWRWWYADKDVRDNRVSFFATYLYGKEYEFSYIVRAQIPGNYNVLPSVGMLMYYPEIRGSGKEIKINITD